MTTIINSQSTIINRPVLYFALAQLRALLRNRRVLASSLLTPVFILGIFWLVAGSSSDADIVARFMFPAIISFAVMMAGGTQATRLVTWRQNKVFQRLAVTPTPVGHLVIGDALAQVALSVGQGVVTLAVGVGLLRLPVDWGGTAVALLVLLLTGAAFIAYGSVIATFAKRAETANTLFVFTLMPMFFLGGGFPPGVLPEMLTAVGRWLPFGAANHLIQPLLSAGVLPEMWGLHLLALAGYTAVFALIAARFFRWE